MTATTPPITQTRFGTSFNTEAQAELNQHPRVGDPSPPARTDSGSRLTIDEAGSPWLPQGNESDEEGPLRLTLTRTQLTGKDELGWQPLGDRVRLASGRRVPGTRYRIVRWLGEGGMGMVFEAIHVDIQRPVALKILKPGVAGSGLQRDRFLDEARAVASVDSRFVVDVLDFGELPDGRPFYTMELLDPVSLSDELRNGPLPLERALPILRQCCKALAAVHQRTMAHRDVKPQNVLIQREDGRTDAVRIVDFGIAAKFCSQPRIAGTAMYMAPEQIRGTKFDERLDVYGLGCVAYELLTGAPPFEGGSAAEVVQRHIHDPVTPPSARLPRLPASLDVVLQRCLAKHPDERYTNMHELEAALCEVQISAGFTTAWDDLPLPAISEAQRSDLRRRMPQPRAERRRVRPPLRVILAACVVALLSAGAMLAIERHPDTHRTEFNAAMRAIADKTEAARVAGSRAYWAYPPASQPDYPTALRMITTLERERGPLRYLARSRADELREEFAETLVRLGDQYWSAPNGRPFAVEFYAQALLFDTAQARARKRASLTPAQLADVAVRAATGKLSPIELEIGEALRALSEEDPARRRERVTALLAEGSPLSRSLRFREQLSDLVGIEARATEPPPTTTAPAPVESARPSGPKSPTKSSKSTAPDPAEASRRARSYLDKGKAALKKAERDRAKRLFEKALAHDPKLADAHAGLAEVHFARGRYQEAMAAARRATKLRPSDASLQLLLGDACLKTMRYADAREAYDKARKLGNGKAAQRLAALDEVTR